MQKDKNLKKPFFSNFLENQLSEEAEKGIQAGGDNQTHKYPSDAEDDFTKKYPSDLEDDVTKPLLDEAQTQKYPSDGDDDVPGLPM